MRKYLVLIVLIPSIAFAAAECSDNPIPLCEKYQGCEIAKEIAQDNNQYLYQKVVELEKKVNKLKKKLKKCKNK